jgi:hypothetical protein
MKEVEYSDLNEGLFDFLKSSESVMKQVCDEILQEEKRIIDFELEKKKEAEFANMTFAEMRKVNRKAIENINAFAKEKQEALPADKKLESNKKIISAHKEGFQQRVEEIYIDFSENNKKYVGELERQLSKEIRDHGKRLRLLLDSADIKIAGNDSRLKYFNSRRATERGILADYRWEKSQKMKDLLRSATLDTIISVYPNLKSLYEQFVNLVSDMESDYKDKIERSTEKKPEADPKEEESTSEDKKDIDIDFTEATSDTYKDLFGGPREIDESINLTGVDSVYLEMEHDVDLFVGKPFKLKAWRGQKDEGNYHFLLYKGKKDTVFFLVEIGGVEIPFYFKKFTDKPTYYAHDTGFVFLPCFGVKTTGDILGPADQGGNRTADANKQSKYLYNYHCWEKTPEIEGASQIFNYLPLISNKKDKETKDKNITTLQTVSDTFKEITSFFVANRIATWEEWSEEKQDDISKEEPRNINFYKNSPQYSVFKQMYSEPNVKVTEMVNFYIKKILSREKTGEVSKYFDELLKTDAVRKEDIRDYNRKFDYILSICYAAIAKGIGAMSADPAPVETVVDEEEIEGDEIEKETDDEPSVAEPAVTSKPDTSSTPPASTTPSSGSGEGETTSDVEPLPFGALYKGKYYTYKYATHSKEGYPILYYGEKGTINDNDQKKNQIIIGTEVEKTLNINVLYNDKEERVRIEPEKIRNAIEDEKLRVKKTENYKHRVKGYEPYFIALGYSYGDEKEVTDEVVIPLIKVGKIAVLIGSSSFLIDGKPVVAGDKFRVDEFNYTILSFVKDKVRVKARNEKTGEEKEVSYALKDLDDLLKSGKRIASTPKRQKPLPGTTEGDIWERKTDDIHLIYTLKGYDGKTGHPIFLIEDKEDGTEKQKTIKRKDFLFDINNNYIKKIDKIDLKEGDLYMTTNLPFKRYEIVSVDLPNKQVSYTSTAFGSNKKQRKTENIADFKRKIEAGNIKFTSSKEMVITEKNTFFKMEDLNLQDGDEVLFYDGKTERKGTYVKGKDFSGIEEGEDFWDIEEEIFANDGSYIVNMSGIERAKSEKPSSKKTTIDDSLKDKPAFEVSAKDEWKEAATGKKWIITGVTDKNVAYRVANTQKINTVPLSRFEKLYKTGKISLVRKSKKQKAGVTNESFFTQIHTKQETNYMKKVKNFQEFTSVNEGFAEWLGGTIRRGVDQALNTTSGKLKNLTVEISNRMKEYLNLYEDHANDYMSAMAEYKKNPGDPDLERDLEQSRDSLLGLQKRYNEILKGFNERAAELYIDKKGNENVELKNAYNQWMAIEEQKIRKMQNAVKDRIQTAKEGLYKNVLTSSTPIGTNIKSYLQMGSLDFRDKVDSLSNRDTKNLENELTRYSLELQDRIESINDTKSPTYQNLQKEKKNVENRINIIRKIQGKTSRSYN